jgi:hypothetical protein
MMRNRADVRNCIISACITLALCLGTSLPAQAGEGSVEQGFRLLREVDQLGNQPFAAAQQGSRFDRLVENFYARNFPESRITTTFAGDDIEHGYRIGNTEIWIQKKGPNQRSIDILIWDLQRDGKGRITGGRAIGMDHHTVHPRSPAATPAHVGHWDGKVRTAQQWTDSLRRRGFNVSIDMNPDNSFYWRDAAARGEVDAFTSQRAGNAGRRLSTEMGRGVFLSTAVRSFGTSLALLNTAQSGVNVMLALERFYRSPILLRVRQLLAQGNYGAARRYWDEKCVRDDTMHRDCEGLRQALVQASSFLAISTHQEFSTGMRALYDRWEAAARSGGR